MGRHGGAGTSFGILPAVPFTLPWDNGWASLEAGVAVLRTPVSCEDRVPCRLLGGAGKFPGHCSGWSCLLSDGWPAPHHPQQHRASAGLRAPALLLQ